MQRRGRGISLVVFSFGLAIVAFWSLVSLWWAPFALPLGLPSVALALLDLRAGRRRRLVWAALIIGSIASVGGAVFWAIALVESF